MKRTPGPFDDADARRAAARRAKRDRYSAEAEHVRGLQAHQAQLKAEAAARRNGS